MEEYQLSAAVYAGKKIDSGSEMNGYESFDNVFLFGCGQKCKLLVGSSPLLTREVSGEDLG
jgi:hypothetical protein